MKRPTQRLERQRETVERLRRQLLFELLVLERLEDRVVSAVEHPPETDGVRGVLARARRRWVSLEG